MAQSISGRKSIGGNLLETYARLVAPRAAAYGYAILAKKVHESTAWN
jgi:hypothetical protein